MMKVKKNDNPQRWEALDESGSRRPQSPSSLSRKAKDLETVIATLKLKEGELQTEKLEIRYVGSQYNYLSIPKIFFFYFKNNFRFLGKILNCCKEGNVDYIYFPLKLIFKDFYKCLTTS